MLTSVAHPSQDGRIGNLVAVQMKDRQHRAIMRRAKELVECQDAASGPVSDLLSPTTQVAIKSGLSNTAL